MIDEQVKQGQLGGYVAGGHPATFFPKLWTHVVQKYNIKSVLDLGCGGGDSTKFFQNLGCTVLGIDGIEDATRTTLTLINNYNESSALTDQQFDLCVCSEFAEHIYAENQHLFLKDFTHAKYILFNAATPGQAAEDLANGFDSHHHVNERSVTYWIKHIERVGFTFDFNESMELRKIAFEDALIRPEDPFNHFIHKGLFFKKSST